MHPDKKTAAKRDCTGSVPRMQLQHGKTVSRRWFPRSRSECKCGPMRFNLALVPSRISASMTVLTRAAIHSVGSPEAKPDAEDKFVE